MTQRKSFLLRLPEGLLDELNRWAKDDLRSLNAQIEFLLREAVRRRRGSRAVGSPPASGDGKDPQAGDRSAGDD